MPKSTIATRSREEDLLDPLSALSREQAVVDGRLKLSQYLLEYEAMEFEPLNVTLVREAVGRLEDLIEAMRAQVTMQADRVKALVEENAAMRRDLGVGGGPRDHGEA